MLLIRQITRFGKQFEIFPRHMASVLAWLQKKKTRRKIPHTSYFIQIWFSKEPAEKNKKPTAELTCKISLSDGTGNGKLECHSIKFSTDGRKLFSYVYEIMDFLTYRPLTGTSCDVCKWRVFAQRFKSLRSNESALSTFIQNKERDLHFSPFLCELGNVKIEANAIC